jgi:hypothetical protein
VPPVIRLHPQSRNIAIGGQRLHSNTAADHRRFQVSGGMVKRGFDAGHARAADHGTRRGGHAGGGRC